MAITRTVSIVNRETGDIATVMDVTGMTDSELARMWDGMVMRIDFEKWMAVDSAKAENRS